MTKQPDTGVEGKSWSPFALLGLVAMAIFFYVLSVGPTVYLVNRKWISENAAMTIYAPVIWAYENTPLRKPLEWYVRIWDRH